MPCLLCFSTFGVNAAGLGAATHAFTVPYLLSILEIR